MNATIPALSMYQRIHDEIIDRIVSGAWSPGHRVPSEMDIAEEYGCSRMTVNKALSQLAREGYIERRRRAGTVVSQPRALSAVLEIRDIESEVRELGLDYGYQLMNRRERAIEAVGRAHFDADTSTTLLEVNALHSAGNRPFCFEERLINLAAVPTAKSEPFAAIAPGAWLLQRVPWNMAEHEIRAVAATRAVAAALDVAAGTPCLAIERRTWNADHVVTFVRLTYLGSSHSLIARFSPSER